ncbi:hypothetical protein SLEP1_g10884 [Rubroshorea leprosula]|uniref:Secreted protein n=1 Tax=Rubroshorea leprosula TaxID=152421 RepID=A0AAV5I9J4_9ROSI|nr:hypothetical protein SLEP1_g10884 [Rubroshorea leprosula]
MFCMHSRALVLFCQARFLHLRKSVKLASVLPKILRLPSLFTADHCSRGIVHRVLFIGTVHTPRVND